MTTESTAITTHRHKGGGMVVRPTRDASAVVDALEEARAAGLNVLAPTSWLETIPPNYEIAVRVVRPRDNSFWPTGGGRNAPRGEFLLELTRAAGVMWRHELIRRIDPMTEPYLCCFEAVCVAPDPATGNPLVYKGTYQLDLREGSATSDDIVSSARSAEKGEAQLRQKRRFIVQLCETGAMLRAARKALGVRGDYSNAEKQKPFVLASLVRVAPDERSAARAEAARDAIYYGGLGNIGATPVPEEPETITIDEVRGEYEAPDLGGYADDLGDVAEASFDADDFDDDGIPF